MRRSQTVRLQQAVQMNDEISDHSVVYGSLCGAFPGRIRSLVIGINADHVEVGEIAKLVAIEGLQLAAKDEMKELRFRWRRFGLYHWTYYSSPEGRFC